ncbi:arylsulfotransferase family protein [Halorussus halophilus]|uniref:arylsulfotransferase family protein n=1 Tax=Halorussus halophilus TaxID=2650975 RepID=UPI0013016F72|nr:arylsulfotransferase family protein [Halorussus halophilus]
MQISSRQHLAVVAAVLCCLSVVTPAVAAPSGQAETRSMSTTSVPDKLCAGNISEPADGMTVVSVQGYKWGNRGGKKPAKLVGVGPNGEVKWVHQSAAKYDVVWGYDVDPMENGNVFVTATVKGHKTIAYELNPRTQERVWVETFDLADTHDIDLINNGTELLVANMRNYHESNQTNGDRIFVYNRETDDIEWQWHFDDHYDRQNMEENYTDDWTHVNDVDKVGEGKYLLSPRNFDQAIVVDRESGDIVMKVGEDGQKDILNEQHNPDYLESENSTPTILVADSDNGRIVEYTNPDGDLTNGQGWNRAWTLEGDLAWPRDADRLQNGNTLVTDSRHSRVVEVTPEGDIVWEFYAPWLVYDAARVTNADESEGPTMSDVNATGTYEVATADKHDNKSAMWDCNERLQSIDGWADGQQPTQTAGTSEGAMDGDTDSGNDDGSGTGSDGSGSTGSSSTIPGFGVSAAIAALAALFAMGVGLTRQKQ